jgi:hypothetical protein
VTRFFLAAPTGRTVAGLVALTLLRGLAPTRRLTLGGLAPTGRFHNRLLTAPTSRTVTGLVALTLLNATTEC